MSEFSLKNRENQARTLSPLDIVNDCYGEYAKFTNEHRSLPSSRDGLKRVQRRIVLTLMGMGQGDSQPCASIVGDCIKKYHPHGDQSIYDTLVKLVNRNVSLLKGQGSFGSDGLVSTGPAAYRYTKAGLSPFAKDFYTPLVKFSNFTMNENDFDEADYLPTPIPYCFVSGAYGIGVGCATNIPAFDLEALKKASIDVIEGRDPDYLVPVDPMGGKITIDEENIKLLNETGSCQVKFSCDIDEETIKENNRSVRVVVVKGMSDYAGLDRLHKEFSKELEDGSIYIKDESRGSKTRVLLGREFRRSRVNEDEILKRTRKCLSKNVTFNCIFSHKGVATMLTPHQAIKYSIMNLLESFKRYVNHNIKKLEELLIYEKVKHQLAKMIMDDMSDDDILKDLIKLEPKMTRELLKEFSAKALSTLKSKQKNVNDITKSIGEWVNKNSNINESYLEEAALRK